LKRKQAGIFDLKIDNQSTIALSNNPVFHDCSKHIELRYHFIRECVERNRVNIQYIGTSEQLAGILTKALGRQHFCELRSRLDIVYLLGIRKN
jgi:hypothetical protein